MKAIALDTPIEIISRQAVHSLDSTLRAMEGGIEAGHLRQRRKAAW